MPGLILLMLPLAELMLALSLARHLGWFWVLAGLLAGAVLGSLLIRLRGAPYFRQAMATMNRPEAPGQQAPNEALVHGLAWSVAGVLLMIPGFITDVLALLLLLPPVRRRAVSHLQRLTEGRLMTMQTVFAGPHGAMGGAMGGTGWPPRQSPDAVGDVFEGEAREIINDAPALDKK